MGSRQFKEPRPCVHGLDVDGKGQGHDLHEEDLRNWVDYLDTRWAI